MTVIILQAEINRRTGVTASAEEYVKSIENDINENGLEIERRIQEILAAARSIRHHKQEIANLKSRREFFQSELAAAMADLQQLRDGKA